MIVDSEAGRRRVVHALIFTAVYSRHMFVWLTFTQTLESIIAGCEAAWRFFGGYAGVDTAVCAQAAREWAQSATGRADVVDTVPGAFSRPGR
jgi:hypothetical protein